MKNNIKVLEYAIQMEKQGHEFYLRNMKLINDPEGKALFEELAAVENEHYNLLKRYRDYLNEDERGSEISLEDETKVFEERLKEAPINFDNLNGSDLAIMRMAYIIENDFAEFYKNAAETAEQPAIKSLLEELSGWENGHRKVFYSRFKDMMQNNWFKQNFAPF